MLKGVADAIIIHRGGDIVCIGLQHINSITHCDSYTCRTDHRKVIATIAEEAGFANVRTLQRRINDVIGMSPVDYRLMLTRDL